VYPHQEIREERTDGSIVVAFMVGSLDEIINILKGWLPHTKIIRPEELKQILLNDMKAWIAWREESHTC
jgi:predicted DNA-binding transcriptional regulator YafY